MKSLVCIALILCIFTTETKQVLIASLPKKQRQRYENILRQAVHSYNGILMESLYNHRRVDETTVTEEEMGPIIMRFYTTAHMCELVIHVVENKDGQEKVILDGSNFSILHRRCELHVWGKHSVFKGSKQEQDSEENREKQDGKEKPKRKKANSKKEREKQNSNGKLGKQNSKGKSEKRDINGKSEKYDSKKKPENQDTKKKRENRDSKAKRENRDRKGKPEKQDSKKKSEKQKKGRSSFIEIKLHKP